MECLYRIREAVNARALFLLVCGRSDRRCFGVRRRHGHGLGRGVSLRRVDVGLFVVQPLVRIALELALLRLLRVVVLGQRLVVFPRSGAAVDVVAARANVTSPPAYMISISTYKAGTSRSCHSTPRPPWSKDCLSIGLCAQLNDSARLGRNPMHTWGRALVTNWHACLRHGFA